MEGAATNRVSYQWRIQEGACPPLIFRPNWGPKVQIFFFRPGPPLSQGLDDWAPLTEGLDPPMHIPMIVIAKASLRI